MMINLMIQLSINIKMTLVDDLDFIIEEHEMKFAENNQKHAYNSRSNF